MVVTLIYPHHSEEIRNCKEKIKVKCEYNFFMVENNQKDNKVDYN